MTEKNTIVFVGKTAFPVSTASSKRIMSFAKGFVSNGHVVYVYCFGLIKKSLYQNDIKQKGSINGVNWVYTNLRVKAFNHKLINGIFLFIGNIIGFVELIKNFYNKKPFFFTSQTGFWSIFPLYLISKICKGKLVFFRSEYPNSYLKNKRSINIIETANSCLVYKKFDLLIFMTHKLKLHFNRWKRNDANAIVIPLTIDLEAFNENLPSPFSFKYFAYCGSVSFQKDGLDILLKSFDMAYKYFPEYKLVIIGEINDKFIGWINENIYNKNQVIITGLVNYKEIPRYLNNAECLVMARPNSLQAEGGFPTKLGEYLATGKPVITTDTGEISHYLTNMESALIAVPGDIEDFAKKLEWVALNKEKAKIIGQKGKMIAEEYFDAYNSSQIILKNLNEIN